jgi:alpha-glucosidase
MIKRYLPHTFSAVVALLLCTAIASGSVVTSPDGRIRFVVDLKELLDTQPGVRLCYSVVYSGKPILLDSPFALEFKGMRPFARDLAITGENRRVIDETWNTVWGKHRQVRNHANELTLNLLESVPPRRKIEFVVRVFNDGAAFRYSIPEQPGIRDFKITGEHSEFRFPKGNLPVWAANYGTFISHQEGEFEKTSFTKIRPGDIIGCPLLVDAGAAWVALTEANLTDWAGMYFTGASGAANSIISLLSPRLDEPEVAVIGQAPRSSPWRVMLVGAKPGDLIESEIIQNLSEPCAIEDTSWIRPGVAAWDRWWCGGYAPDAPGGKVDMGTASMKYFVDFAADMGWQYQLVDWTWYGPPFDPDKAFGMAGNPKADLSRVIPDLDLPGLIHYAGQKGVRILIWLDCYNADKQMERVFPLYEKWGVAGVKVDFMQRDDQEMVNFYERLVKLAARHHLIVDFHGAFKPTGIRRTWPNLLTREGVMGNEYNKWSARITPQHNVTLPFTRMLCGPMDFTPGGFRNKTVKDFRAVGGDEPGPFVMGTRTHQLAMMVVYESPLQVMCDSPYSYRMSPQGLDFLKAIPTSWTDTKVLDGYPGQYVAIARQSGENWYIGAMNGDVARTLQIPLSFVGAGQYRATLWFDAEEVADYPERVWVKEDTVGAGRTLQARLASGGGFVARLVPLRK